MCISLFSKGGGIETPDGGGGSSADDSSSGDITIGDETKTYKVKESA